MAEEIGRRRFAALSSAEKMAQALGGRAPVPPDERRPAKGGTPGGDLAILEETVGVRRGPEIVAARWNVVCGCGFAVIGLGTIESARDTLAWHCGDDTTPLGMAPYPCPVVLPRRTT